jgi:hypothetical protein
MLNGYVNSPYLPETPAPNKLSQFQPSWVKSAFMRSLDHTGTSLRRGQNFLHLAKGAANGVGQKHVCSGFEAGNCVTRVPVIRSRDDSKIDRLSMKHIDVTRISLRGLVRIARCCNGDGVGHAPLVHIAAGYDG